MTRTRRPVERRAFRWRMEDARVDRVSDDDGLDESKPELAVLLEAVARLEDRRVGELLVHRGNPSIGAVVESPVDADRPIHAVHQTAVRAHEPTKTSQVEVEGVEQTRRGASGDPIHLHASPRRSSSRGAHGGTGDLRRPGRARIRGRPRGRHDLAGKPAPPAPCARAARRSASAGAQSGVRHGRPSAGR